MKEIQKKLIKLFSPLVKHVKNLEKNSIKQFKKIYASEEHVTHLKTLMKC